MEDFSIDVPANLMSGGSFDPKTSAEEDFPASKDFELDLSDAAESNTGETADNASIPSPIATGEDSVEAASDSGAEGISGEVEFDVEPELELENLSAEMPLEDPTDNLPEEPSESEFDLTLDDMELELEPPEEDDSGKNKD